METETKQTQQQEAERRNKLSIEIADIINSFGDINELKDTLSTINVKKQKTKEDWVRELNKAIEVGYFPRHCKKSSENWGCCAVGSRIQIEDPDLAKRSALRDGWGTTGGRLTKIAAKLGVEFWEAVNDDEPNRAKKIFDEIQSLPRIFKTEQEIAKEWKGMKYYLKKVFLR